LKVKIKHVLFYYIYFFNYLLVDIEIKKSMHIKNYKLNKVIVPSFDSFRIQEINFDDFEENYFKIFDLIFIMI